MTVFPQFATPHCHPQSLDSASTPDAFLKRELSLGGVALTCTDHGTLQAAQQVFALAKKAGIQPIVGLEAYFRDDDCPILGRLGVPRTVSTQKWAPKGVLSYADHLKYQHLTLHFMDYDAYLCGVRLLSKADLRAEQHGSERKPLFDWAAVEELAAHNVTATSSCLIGIVSRHLLNHQDTDAARAYFAHLHHLFGDRFYTELFPHVCSHNWSEAVYIDLAALGDVPAETVRFYYGKNLLVGDSDRPGREPVQTKSDGLQAVVRRIGTGATLLEVQHNRKWTPLEPGPRRITGVRAERGFIQNECSPAAPGGDVQWGANMYALHLATKAGVPILVSDDSHFANPEEHVVQDIRLSSPHHTWKFHNSYHRFSSSEAWDYFSTKMGVPETQFRQWVDNSIEWAGRFKGFQLDTSLKLGAKFYPTDTLAHTRDLITAYGRLSDAPEYRERLIRQELPLLHRNGTLDLLPYFFTDEEVVRVYRNQGWLTGPGRGSAAGLYLSYLLGITHVDPIRYGLSLERFFTPDRAKSGKLPDIDQDLPFREPLEGWEVDVVEFTADDDGTTHLLPEIWRLETDAGLMTVDQAVASKTPVRVWWRFAETASTTLTVTRRSRTDRTLKRWFPGWFAERFGDHIAQMSVDSTLKIKMAVKDVARARHGFVPPDIEAACKEFEEAPMGVSDSHHVLGYKSPEGDFVPGSITRDRALQNYAARYPDDFEIVKKILGLSRHRGRHPCGFVLGDRPIQDFIPLQTIKGVRVTAFTAGPVEAVGGVKMDFLVVNNIHDIQTAMELVRQRHGMVEGSSIVGTPEHHLVPLPDRSRNADIWDLPADPAVFADFAAGRTETVFQYHTDGARDWLRYFDRNRSDGRPLISDIRDLAIFTALDRPGPLDVELRNPDTEGARHNALVEYTRKASGLKGSPDLHPAVERLLPETHGVIIFQEQVQKIYQQITGCTGPEAEEFRRKVAKKEDEKLKANKPVFMERASAILGSAEDAEGVWAMLRTFSQYGFNLSHATCYAVIGYACAWLKHHYPLEWWCGLLRHADKEKINTRLWPHVGSRVALPDLGLSGAEWDIRGDRLQAPMTLLTGIGPTAHAQLCHYAPYRSIGDLADAIKRYRDDHTAIAQEALDAAARMKAEAAKAAEKDGRPESDDTGTEAVEEVEAEGVDSEGGDTDTEAAAEAVPADLPPAATPEKAKTPRSPIHRTIVYNLIVAGATDSLFPAGLTVDGKLAAFDDAMLARFGKKYRQAMKNSFPQLDSIAQYQTIKKVLAPYGDDLRTVLPGALPEFLTRDGDTMSYHSLCWDRDEQREVLVEDGVVGYETVRELADATTLPEGGYRCAVLAYVDAVRVFQWGPGKSSEGMELTLEIGGGKIPATRWPQYGESRISDPDKARLAKGAIIAAIMHRSRADKSFSVRVFDVVRAPLAGPAKKAKKG